nr:uncharacterized protein LOC111841739 [Paramormyrops kingsleyae]
MRMTSMQMSFPETVSDSLCRNSLVMQTDCCCSCPGGWSQAILEVNMLDVKVLGWCGYTWSAVVRLVGCTAKFSETLLETAYGRKMNIHFMGNSSVIAYASHTLSSSERRWSTFDRELWAVVWSVRHFKHFLSGSSFTVVTDHKPLLSLKKSSVDNDPTGRRSRWILELDVYDYNIVHREGKQHANADAMSRRPNTDTQSKAVQCVISTITSRDRIAPVDSDRNDNTAPVFSEVRHTLSVDLVKLRDQQREDGCLSEVIAWLEGSASKLWHEFPRLVLRHGILCRKIKAGPCAPASFQVVLPATLIPTALATLHGNPFSGHQGTAEGQTHLLLAIYVP